MTKLIIALAVGAAVLGAVFRRVLSHESLWRGRVRSSLETAVTDLPVRNSDRYRPIRYWKVASIVMSVIAVLAILFAMALGHDDLAFGLYIGGMLSAVSFVIANGVEGFVEGRDSAVRDLLPHQPRDRQGHGDQSRATPFDQ